MVEIPNVNISQKESAVAVLKNGSDVSNVTESRERFIDPVELMPGVWAVGGSRLTGIDEAHSIVLAEGRIQIDTGSPHGHDRLVENRRNIFGRDPEYVFLTHAHYDHAGDARAQEEAGAKVFIGDEDYEALITGDRERTAAFVYDEELNPPQSPIPLRGAAMSFGRFRIEAFPTPGHTPGSMSYLIQSKDGAMLATGDSVMIGRFDLRFGSNIEDWKQTIANLSSPRFRRMRFLPGHGNPVLHDISMLSEAAVGFHQPKNGGEPWNQVKLARYVPPGFN
jgi:glyoxylase-like metal-dependent hydrolase (beta-lactamase superfamily II)